ncbi:MAG: B12-binding domain-containing radical SAM protein [Actinobacteria bacterium]|nr:B12-binding domain-containing radical SAM protein [Actinomycetota bacterium]
MKVLFVYPDINVKGGALSYHFGIGSLSAVLKKEGHETALQYLYGSYDIKALLEKIEQFEPGILAITSVSFQYKYIKKMLAETKNIHGSKIFTICGGPHISLAPQELRKTEGLDAICIGEGEYPLLELANKLQSGEDITNIENIWVKKDGKIYQNPNRPLISDIDSLPFGDRELFNYQEIVNSDYDRAIFMCSRGCPYSCTYCCNSGLRGLQEGKYVRFRSIENVLAEIKEVISNYNVKYIYLNDDVFTENREYVSNFCIRYKEEIGYPFELNTRVEHLTPEMLQSLKDAGCYRVAMGIEQGDEKFRREILNRRMSNEKIEAAFELTKKAGIRTKSFNIVGFPFETYDIHMETVKINRKVQPSSLVVYVFEPYPGTPLYDMCVKNHFIEEDRQDMDFISRTDTTLNMPDFTRKQILKCYRNFAWRVYRGKSYKKALLHKIYYSKYGELLIRLLSPFKKIVRKFAMD